MLGPVLAFALAVDGGASSNELTTLEAQLGRDTTELSTSDCAAACKALASIRRAADRICELEQGPRCTAAREKAAAAGKRVHDACPDCAIASLPTTPAPEREERAMAPAPPPSEAKGGGCRSCATSPPPASGDFAVLALAALAVLGTMKNARRRR